MRGDFHYFPLFPLFHGLLNLKTLYYPDTGMLPNTTQTRHLLETLARQAVQRELQRTACSHSQLCWRGRQSCVPPCCGGFFTPTGGRHGGRAERGAGLRNRWREEEDLDWNVDGSQEKADVCRPTQTHTQAHTQKHVHRFKHRCTHTSI